MTWKLRAAAIATALILAMPAGAAPVSAAALGHHPTAAITIGHPLCIAFPLNHSRKHPRFRVVCF